MTRDASDHPHPSPLPKGEGADPDNAHDIAIIGAGAAGMMAAITAGRAGASVVALDGAKKLGAKILVSGGGRCNVTHDALHAEDFAGGNRNRINKVLRSFTVEQTVAFFDDLGVTLKRENTGKLFPTTDRARTVLNALIGAMRDADVDIRTDHRVSYVARNGSGFIITTNQCDLHTKRIVLATGGLSLPKTGSDGAGYRFARALGHTVTDTHPALVPLVLPDGHWLTSLSGIAHDAVLTLHGPTGRIVHRQAGAMLCTHFGLSGPAVMDISRHWIAQPDHTLRANLLPGVGFDDLDQDLRAASAHATIVSILRQRLPERLATGVIQYGADMAPTIPMSRLTREERRRVVHAVTALPLPIERDRGYLFAEVTAGGVPLEELDIATMASRVCPGLYLCGEILNVDGRIGGYNFQWAWCTGRLAGMAAADDTPREPLH